MNTLLEGHLNEPVVGRNIEMNPLLEGYLNEPVTGGELNEPVVGSFRSNQMVVFRSSAWRRAVNAASESLRSSRRIYSAKFFAE